MTNTVDKVIIQSETQGVQQSTDQLNKLGKSMDGVTVAASSVEKSTGSVDSKFASLERRFATTAGQASQFEKIQRTVNAAIAQNPELQGRANEVLGAAQARYVGSQGAVKELAEAHKGLNAQGQAALHSIRSVAEQLALGIPITQAATGQINHLTFAASGQGGLAGAFKQVIGLVSGFITPTNAAIAGAVALTAAAAAAAVQLDKVQVSSQRALGGAGQRTGTTVSDLNQFASQNSGISGTGLSSKEARALGEDLTKTGEIVISRLHGMSDAVVGFSNQTGVSMDEARKAMVGFAVDPKKGLEELAQTYGSFDTATRKAVDALVLADDKTGAFQVVLDALSEKSKTAANNMGFFEKATRSVVNVLASETSKPVGLEGQLAAAQAKLAQEGNGAARSSGSTERLRQEVLDLQAAIEKVNAQNAAAEINKLSTAADGADRAIIPQIAQLEQLKAKLEELERAKAAGATSKYGAGVDNAAIASVQNLIAATQQAQAETARYNERVKEISLAWGDVGQSTALTLQAAQNQLPVIQAVGGSVKMAAQYAANYANAIDHGKTSTEAAALAASNLEAAQAAAVTAAKQSTAALQEQNNVMQAGLGLQGSAKISAEGRVEAEQKYKDVLMETGSQQQAMAAKQAVNRNTDLKATDAAIQEQEKYNQELAEHAEKLQAISAANAQWVSDLFQVGSAARQAAGYLDQAQAADQQAAGAEYDARHNAPIEHMPSGQHSFVADPRLSVAYKGGGTGKRLDLGLGPFAYLDSSTDDFTARGKKEMNDLLDSVKNLTKSTDALNATQMASLNPLYSGRGALAVGYYHAATGLDMVAQGPSSGDQVPFHAMVNGGERIQITPAGQTSASSNDNSKTIINNNNFNFSGSQSTSRRSARSLQQGFSQVMAAVS